MTKVHLRDGNGEGNDVDDDISNDSKMEEDSVEEEINTNSNQKDISQTKEKCSVELRHMVVLNELELKKSSMLAKEEKNETIEEKWSIDSETNAPVANEEFLLNKNSQACGVLISQLFSLPIEKRSDVGVLATLPKLAENIFLPRELPPPKPKPMTRWEKFAQARGMSATGKRSRKVWDEAHNEWRYLTGFQKANRAEDMPIIEVKKNDNPFEDPWERLRAEKRQRVQKNTLNQIRNQERAGLVAKGTSSRLLKDIKKRNLQSDAQRAMPHGIPVDLKPNKTDDAVSTKLRGKALVNQALAAAQTSTASLGKFDAMLEGEPRRNKQKKKSESTVVTASKKLTEQQVSLKVLNRVINNGGGSKREKDIKKGLYAKGETGYDFDYDDGLSASDFKKKKGKAGVGKLKKMTKKRMK